MMREKVENLSPILPFPLTNAQKRVVNEILSDIKSPYRMNRLLQGDVGSGKTVVAAIVFICKCNSRFPRCINGANGNSRGTAC